MARGNQREKAREKNLKASAGQVRYCLDLFAVFLFFFVCLHRPPSSSALPPHPLTVNVFVYDILIDVLL